MKGIKTLVSATALFTCLGAASMANAASIVFDSGATSGNFTTPGGSLTVRSPSSFGAAVTCDINFSGLAFSNNFDQGRQRCGDLSPWLWGPDRW